MKVMKQRLVLVPLVIGMLGLAAACSSQAPAPVAPVPSRASAPAAAAATSPTTATTPPSAAGAQVPARVASAIAVASARAGQGQAPSSAKKIDACSLVTQAEAAAAAGVDLPRQHAYDETNGPTCAYTEDDPNGISVTVAIQQSGGKGRFDRTAAMIGPNRQDLPGISDGAYIVTGLRMLYALNGDTLLTIQVANPSLSDDVYRARLATLAKTALSRV